MHTARIHYKPETLPALIAAGSDANYRNENNDNLLHIYAETSSFSEIELLKIFIDQDFTIKPEQSRSFCTREYGFF